VCVGVSVRVCLCICACVCICVCTCVQLSFRTFPHTHILAHSRFFFPRSVSLSLSPAPHTHAQRNSRISKQCQFAVLACLASPSRPFGLLLKRCAFLPLSPFFPFPPPSVSTPPIFPLWVPSFLLPQRFPPPLSLPLIPPFLPVSFYFDLVSPYSRCFPPFPLHFLYMYIYTHMHMYTLTHTHTKQVLGKTKQRVVGAVSYIWRSFVMYI